ncbi:MAG TPA: peptidylprolyl isomerase [Thermoanaerobaculia bacterium]
MKKDILRAAIAVVAIGAICYGLAAARPPAPPEQPFTARGGGSDKIVMRVNGEPITEREFNAFLLQAPEQMQLYYSTPEGRRLLADEVVKLKALEQEGIRRGIEKDREVQTQLEMNRTSLLAGSALRQIIGRPNEQRLRAEYEKERKQFETSELSHILVSHEGSAIPPRAGKPLPFEQAALKAGRILARLKAGFDFAEVARTESDDLQSAANGGSLGPIAPESLPPQLREATQNLQPGQVSDPVRSEFGIHIFKAGERKAQPYEQVRDALAARIQRNDAEATIERLQKSAEVEFDPKFFPPAKTPRGEEKPRS